MKGRLSSSTISLREQFSEKIPCHRECPTRQQPNYADLIGLGSDWHGHQRDEIESRGNQPRSVETRANGMLKVSDRWQH